MNYKLEDNFGLIRACVFKFKLYDGVTKVGNKIWEWRLLCPPVPTERVLVLKNFPRQQLSSDTCLCSVKHNRAAASNFDASARSCLCNRALN